MNPLCQCGCGLEVKSKEHRFVKGHHSRVISVKRKINPVKCIICNIEFKQLSTHLKYKHNLTIQEYYDRFLKKNNEDICPVCGKKKKFKGCLRYGYGDFCDHSCSMKNKDLQKKFKETQQIRNTNQKKTNIANGRWIPDDLLSDYQLYGKLVSKFTNNTLNQNCNLFDLSKRKKAGIDGAYHIDHKFSICEGFKNYIPPFIIGSLANLEMIPWDENIQKDRHCSISKEDLFSLYYQQNGILI